VDKIMEEVKHNPPALVVANADGSIKH
jgi:hypothetical protein